MKLVEWKTYRTRFLVKAKQLSSSLSFTDPLGRQHCGRKGDYLVESSDGVITITPRQIFEDIYVFMPTDNATSGRRNSTAPDTQPQRFDGLARFETLQIEKMREYPGESSFRNPSPPIPENNSRVRRKSPQPVRPGLSRMSLL
jgi:hypothetical protein